MIRLKTLKFIHFYLPNILQFCKLFIFIAYSLNILFLSSEFPRSFFKLAPLLPLHSYPFLWENYSSGKSNTTEEKFKKRVGALVGTQGLVFIITISSWGGGRKISRPTWQHFLQSNLILFLALVFRKIRGIPSLQPGLNGNGPSCHKQWGSQAPRSQAPRPFCLLFLPRPYDSPMRAFVPPSPPPPPSPVPSARCEPGDPKQPRTGRVRSTFHLSFSIFRASESHVRPRKFAWRVRVSQTWMNPGPSRGSASVFEGCSPHFSCRFPPIHRAWALTRPPG